MNCLLEEVGQYGGEKSKSDDILGHTFSGENVELPCFQIIAQFFLGKERKKAFADSNIGIHKGQCSLETRFESS